MNGVAPNEDSVVWSWCRQMARTRLWDLVALIIAVAGLAQLAFLLPGRAVENDFADHYAGSRLLLEDHNPYTTPLAPEYQLLAPVATWPVRVAFWVWTAVQAISLAAVLWMTRRLVGERLPPRAWRWIGAVTLASPAVFWHFFFGQTQLLLAALLLAAYARQRGGRPLEACVWVCLAGLLKLFPLALLPWFVYRADNEWRGRVRAGALAGVVLAIGVTVTGIGLWLDFVRYPSHILSGWAMGPTFFNFSISSLVTALAKETGGTHVSAKMVHAWWVAGAALGSTMLVLSYTVCFHDGGDPEAEFCLLTVMMLAGSVMAWGYYFVLLIFPVIVAVARLVQEPTLPKTLGMVLGLLSLNCLDAGQWEWGGQAARVWFNYLPLAGLIGLALFFGAELRQRKALR
jgi:hypothetical protein